VILEQAIFTSARTRRSDGYQLVAHSPGIVEEDTRALSKWGPSHDSLRDPDLHAESVNFHQLPSGAYAVSKTTAAGGEHSERAGPQVYTQYLVAPRDSFSRFSNNPFALLTAACAQGTLDVRHKVPRHLEPVFPRRVRLCDEEVGVI